MQMKTCRVCKIEKPLSEMVIAVTSLKKIHYKSVCKLCQGESQKITSQLKKQFPYPEDGYLCPICKKTSPKWYLDHNWETGEFRSWLCNSCNIGLGQFRDDIDLLNKAIAYLSK
jgi:protein-arginine kinase activator protein McsA